MHVIVVLADLVSSRQIVDRRAFQKRLARAIAALGQGRRDLLSPWTVTLGDEFQAVYRNAGHVFRDAFELRRAVHPHRVRYVIAAGEITTVINPRQAIGMDGPAFHRARDGMQALKESGGTLRLEMPTGPAEAWVRPALELVGHSADGWKPNRFEVARRLFDGQEVAEIARAMRLTPAAIYKNIQAGALGSVLEICREVTRVIDRGSPAA